MFQGLPEPRFWVMAINLPVLAGTLSTVIFAASVLPMLVRARRTRDLASYSLGNIALSNLGNALNSIYIFTLPVGPIWALHSFHVITTGLMLAWYMRYGSRRVHRNTHAPLRDELHVSPDERRLVRS
jgi:hypothetical protein